MPIQMNDVEKWVDEYGDYLFQYARMHLRSPANAEDVVQDTFLAAFKSRGRFTGKSSVKTWLTGILKHKIVDHIRKHSTGDSQEDTTHREDVIEARLNHKVHWEEPPTNWMGNPEETAESMEFFKIFRQCLENLPGKLQEIFSLREIQDMSGKEICKVLNISSTNFWVMTHRARAKLRQCLEVHWGE